jgi:hypothetical protein
MTFLERRRMAYSLFPERGTLAGILGEFLRGVIDDVLEHRGGRLYLEKNTWNILWFDRILELLPEARLVHIYRDPRDVVASFTKQRWMPSEPTQSAVICRDLLERWWDVRRKLPSHSFMEVSLEALTKEPESVLRDICGFWDLRWHSALLETDLSGAHAGRWKKDFNLDEQRAVQTILLGPLEAMGYE